jgi:pimeloyl-ACP methyl ester carboxylesterase
MAVHEVELSAGTIEYQDTGGSGPVIVLLHGLAMDGSLWRHVVARLRPNYRCILPTLPLGGHRRPMRPDADLSLSAMVRLVAEFLERLNLYDVTLVGNDWGGAQLLISEGRAERVGRLVLVACEAFENYPPGLPGKAAALAAKVPGGISAAFQPLRLRPMRRLPFTWGWMSKRPVPDEVMDAWLRPVQTSREIRRDLRKYAGSVPPKEVLLEWAERQRSFEGPVLVVWAWEDRVMPREHGRRLAELFPAGRLVEVADSYTLIPEDQPAMLAAHIRGFVNGQPETNA